MTVHVLFEPGARRTIRAADLRHTSDYTPYESLAVRGSVRSVFVRGRAVIRDGTLVGERRYVYGLDVLRPIPFPRQALHAYRLSFRHPVDNRPLSFEAPPPPDFAELLAQLRREAASPRPRS